MGCSGGVSFATEMRFSGAFGARVVWQVAGGGAKKPPRAHPGRNAALFCREHEGNGAVCGVGVWWVRISATRFHGLGGKSYHSETGVLLRHPPIKESNSA